MEGETDELGWQYSTDFASGLHRNCAILFVAIHSIETEVLGNTGWLPYCASMSFVRRRRIPPNMICLRPLVATVVGRLYDGLQIEILS